VHRLPHLLGHLQAGLDQPPRWGPNWDDNLAGTYERIDQDPLTRGIEEQVQATYEQAFMFYLPRICEHCLSPSCVASCPSGAMYKRDEDGIVLVDQAKCRGWRFCVSGCPYEKVYFNHRTGKAESDAARRSPVYALAHRYRVALPLHPEYRTLPMVWYVPPLSPIVNTLETDGYEANPDDVFGAIEHMRIPIDYLANLLAAGDSDVIRECSGAWRRCAATCASSRCSASATTTRSPAPGWPWRTWRRCTGYLRSASTRTAT
jgi:nitrate reductase beta subunit